MRAAARHEAAAARGAHAEREPSAMVSMQPSPCAGADTLASFQAAFASALLADSGDASAHPGVRRLVAQPAFAVYRNTFLKACVDALVANYPAVARLMGEEWLRPAAALYVRSAPPSDAMLIAYGRGFSEFLAEFAPAAEYPYLPDVACLDRCWTEAHIARTQESLSAQALAGLAPERLAALVLRPLPSARWQWFAHAPVFTIWSRNRFDATVEAVCDWHGEGALLLRPEASVQGLPLAAGGCAFLDACAAGHTLAEAAAAALCADPGCDVADLLRHLLVAGAFAAPAKDADALEGESP